LGGGGSWCPAPAIYLYFVSVRRSTPHRHVGAHRATHSHFFRGKTKSKRDDMKEKKQNLTREQQRHFPTTAESTIEDTSHRRGEDDTYTHTHAHTNARS
jgi:hypothetical protein